MEAILIKFLLFSYLTLRFKFCCFATPQSIVTQPSQLSYAATTRFQVMRFSIVFFFVRIVLFVLRYLLFMPGRRGANHSRNILNIFKVIDSIVCVQFFL